MDVWSHELLHLLECIVFHYLKFEKVSQYHVHLVQKQWFAKLFYQLELFDQAEFLILVGLIFINLKNACHLSGQ